MRIVSQDGCYDLPYERALLKRVGTSIFAKTTFGDLIVVAQYHEEEKAIKAMEICTRKYEIFNAAVFRFPKSQEIEP